MGMLYEGQWINDDNTVYDGEFKRPVSIIQDAQSKSSQRALKTPGRVWLIASFSCPWSHRTTLTRQLKSLNNWIPVHHAFGPRNKGYSLNDGDLWNIPGSNESYRHLHEMYQLHYHNYTGRVTVPLLWDSETKKILSNESSDISLALDKLPGNHRLEFTLRPPNLLRQLEDANDMIYHNLNNAVYQAGFAQTQTAYKEAVEKVFETLDNLELHLQSNRFYFGNVLTETDIRLFPTLIRFDSIYYILFKCCQRRILDYPALSAYTRDILQLQGVKDTINFDVMRTQSYLNDSDSLYPIVAIQTDTDWHENHNREGLGPIQVSLRDGCLVSWL